MEKIKRQLGIFKNVETIVVMALFIALSIVLGKFVAINILQDFRISLENTPVIIAAVAYGPLAGAIVGGLSDMIGCMLVGYTINPDNHRRRHRRRPFGRDFRKAAIAQRCQLFKNRRVSALPAYSFSSTFHRLNHY